MSRSWVQELFHALVRHVPQAEPPSLRPPLLTYPSPNAYLVRNTVYTLYNPKTLALPKERVGESPNRREGVRRNLGRPDQTHPDEQLSR